MKRILLDTGAASDFINRRHGVFERARQVVADGAIIGIGVPVLAELAAGIENSVIRDRNMRALQTALSALKIWPFDNTAAFEYGRIYAEMIRIGRPIGSIDMMVAAIALTLSSCTVISTDNDLLAVPGLQVENWRT